MTDIASAFLLDLHRSSRRLPHAELRAWIFANLKSVVAFDSAFWFRWAAHDGQSHIHAWCLHGQPDSLIHEYTASELWKDDVVYSRTLNADRGTAIRASYDDYSSVRMRDFLRRHRQEHIMTIAIMQDVPQTAVGMSLYRNETHEAFLAEDGRAFEAVMPHVVEAWRENWLRDIVRATSTAPAPVNFSMALLMPDGMMSEAQDNLGELMHLEWPDWQGPFLPEVLASHLRRDAKRTRPWVGRGITVYDRRQADGTTLMLVRRGHALDQVAPRKREVALLFARGASQSQVAEQLHLSTSTVNNYLVGIYQQLQLSDKTDLSRLITRLEP